MLDNPIHLCSKEGPDNFMQLCTQTTIPEEWHGDLHQDETDNWWWGTTDFRWRQSSVYDWDLNRASICDQCFFINALTED